jgi:serine/threonine protein kinase
MNHGLPQKLCREITRQIAEGLSHLHAEKIIHYDIKPGNVLFDKNGNVKLADFGLSKILDECGKEIDLTSQGAGTYWYLPPECFKKGKNTRISSKVDVWSLGVVLYQMIYNKKPFFNDYSQEQILSSNSIDDSLVVLFPPRPKIKADTKEFITACLHSSPLLRPEISALESYAFLQQPKPPSRTESTELLQSNKNQNDSTATGWIRHFFISTETQQWLREPQDTKEVVKRANEWAKREYKEPVKPVKVIGLSVTAWDNNMEWHHPEGKYIKRKNTIKQPGTGGLKQITTCQWIPKDIYTQGLPDNLKGSTEMEVQSNLKNSNEEVKGMDIDQTKGDIDEDIDVPFTFNDENNNHNNNNNNNNNNLRRSSEIDGRRSLNTSSTFSDCDHDSSPIGSPSKQFQPKATSTKEIKTYDIKTEK